MVDKTIKCVNKHITVPLADWERWQAHKIRKYDGLNAMSKMIRDYVNEGITRETMKGK